jgi:hypothetical protein
MISYFLILSFQKSNAESAFDFAILFHSSINLQFLGLALPEKTENMSILVRGFNPSENMKVS